MILFSDLHLKPESEKWILGEVLPGIRAACLQHRDFVVGFLGDFWHLRYTVDVRLQNAVRDELLRWKAERIELLVLPGNHDQVDIAGRNALEVFDDLDHVTVFTQPRWTRYGLWIPYRARVSDIGEALKIPRPEASMPKLLWMHHGIRGAQMNNWVVDTEGLPIEMFQTFQKIFCGHYHKRQWIGDRVCYIGSPWQTTAHEIGQAKGYAVWNGESMQWVDTNWGPKHWEFVLTTPNEKLDLSMVKPQDYVKVKVQHAGIDTEQMAQVLAKAGVLPVIENAVQKNVELRLGDANSLEEYAVKYAQTFGVEQSLDIQKLMATFTELTS